MSIQSRYRHTLVVKRMAAALGTAAETVGGADTTLTADTAAGAMAVEIADVTGVDPDAWLRVSGTEIRQVATVIALVVIFTAPLELAHDSGDEVRQVDDSGIATDDYGQPVMAETTVATVSGLLQPRSAREVAQANQAGAVIGEYVAYMDPLPTIGPDCWIERDGTRYDVVMDATAADAAGLGDHYEVGCRRVAS